MGKLFQVTCPLYQGQFKLQYVLMTIMYSFFSVDIYNTSEAAHLSHCLHWRQ